MKSILCIAMLIIAPHFACASEILYRQGFETPVEANPEIQWITSGYPVTQAIVEHMPKEGLKSVRGNFNSNVTDSITGLKGEPFVQFKINFKDVPTLKDWYPTTDEIYVSWWFKHDICFWKGPNFANTDPIATTGKFGFIRMNEDPATAYYFTTNGGADGAGVLSANSWNSLWEGWYNRASLWLASEKSWGADGRWHKLSFYIGKKNDGQKYMMWWIDDHLMMSDNYEPDGKHKIYNDFVMDSIQFWHIKMTDISDSENIGTNKGICNGWQIDDVQVWDGIPSKPMPPTPN